MKKRIDYRERALEDLDCYMDGFIDVTKKVENDDFIKDVVIDKGIIRLFLSVPIPSAKCVSATVDENDESIYVYEIKCDKEWNGNTTLYFYGYCYYLNVVSNNDNRIKVAFSNIDDLKTIIRKMVLSEVEYRSSWLICNYNEMVKTINKYYDHFEQKKIYSARLKDEEIKYKNELEENDALADEFYEVHRYDSDSILWERKSIKMRYERFLKEINTNIWVENAILKRLKIPNFDTNSTPENRHVVCYSKKSKLFYCF